MLFSKIQLSKARPFILIVLSIFLFIHQSIAQCNSQIGELKVLNFQHEDGIFICYNDTLKVEVEGYELVDSQKLYYVYHTDRDNFDLTLKVDTVNTIGLINNSYPYNVKLYATAIVAKLNENNSFSISDSCAVFSNTLEFIFLESIVVEHKLKCIRGSDQKYDITFYLTGGLPKLDSMYTYFITGDYNSFGTNVTEIKLLDQDNYFIHISTFDENGCINTFSKPIDCSRLPISLLSFEGIRNKDGHLLKWITAMEQVQLLI